MVGSGWIRRAVFGKRTSGQAIISQSCAISLDKLLFSCYTIFVTEKDQHLLQEGWALFTRIFMKYDILEKSPIDLGTGEKLSAVHVHMIEAIGKGYGITVTALSGYFMITKGAVSQVISKLQKMGYVNKTKRKGNDKEIILRLTEKGQGVFELHEKNNASTISDLMKLKEKYSQAEILAFLNILNDVDGLLSKFIAEEKQQ